MTHHCVLILTTNVKFITYLTLQNDIIYNVYYKNYNKWL